MNMLKKIIADSGVAVVIVCLALMATLALAQDAPPPAPPTPPEPPAAAPAAEQEKNDKEPEAPAKPAEKRPVQPADYGKWESLGQVSLSPDGRWIAYAISRVNDDSELRIRMLATDTTDSIKHASSPRFSADSRYLAYAIGVSEADREAAQKANKPIRNKLALRNLITGNIDEIDNVASFSFSDDGRMLIMRRYPITGRKSSGVDIVLRDLNADDAASSDTNFGNVASFSFNDDGLLLAMIIDAEDKAGNGVQLYDAATGVLRTLAASAAKYSNLTWRKDADDLAVLREHDHADDEDAAFAVLAWKGLAARDSKPSRHVYDQTTRDNHPADLRIVDFAGLRWSDDGETLFFGLKAWENKPKDFGKAKDGEGAEKKTDEESAPARGRAASKKDDSPKPLRETIKDPAGVEVWHAADIDIIPLQKRQATRDRRENFLAAWWLESDAVIQLGNDLTESITLLENHKLALGLDNTPYETEKRFGPTLNDIHLVDVRTGERTQIISRNKYRFGSSPDGRYVLYIKDNHFWSFDAQTSQHHNLTSALTTSFINDENSTLTDEKNPHGICGWTSASDRVLLYDKYDIWVFAPDASTAPLRITDGAEHKIRHRRVVLDPDDDRHIDPDRVMYLSLYGDDTKKSGYGRLTLAENRTKCERLVWKDKGIGRLTKAKDVDVFSFVEQAFDDSPDVFVANGSLADARRVSETNPFQKDYLWGRSELIDFTNAHGKPMQGALAYPANYEPGKTYPMIVYIYEERSQTLHSYSTPSERSPYNPAVFSAEGYFVFQPDIVYRPQNPGLSAVECVVPAVKKVLETGMIDESRIGLVGHSWGAYQTAFIVTQTDLFAAGVAGAPLTNMMSMSMSIYWNSGQTDAWIFHESQGRMDQPFWKDVETYIKNSPIFNIDNMNTPLLIAFGDEDGAVDFNQGVEMYNAARLAGKQFVMLVYPGENHSLSKKPNQVDYHYRIREWFDHYLKDADAPKWITEGQKHLEREKEIAEMKKNQK